MRRAGTRFLILAVLVFLMAMPLFMAASVVGDRRETARNAHDSVAQEWAGDQVISGPRLVVPVTAAMSTTETLDSNGDAPATRRVTRDTEAAALSLLPEDFSLSAKTDTEIRHRGVFDVPLYTADLEFTARFAVPDLTGIIADNETVQWRDARMLIDISHNKGLRGEASITANGQPLRLEPVAAEMGSEGIEALAGDPRSGGLLLEGRISLRGSGSLRITPVGRISRISLSGNWPDPGFAGVLPDRSETGMDGFSGEWVIPHLARTLPQVSRATGREDFTFRMGNGDFPAVQFLSPNDFYQKAFRATRYAILMIALTFLTVWLVEDRAHHPAHPVQYLLIGLAQALFAVLMVAYAEHIGFGPAYLGASIATVALLTLFGATGLRLGRRSWVLAALLIALYAVLWLILQSVDYALLAGATLAFLALAATMILTRDENWYGAPGPRPPDPEP